MQYLTGKQEGLLAQSMQASELCVITLTRARTESSLTDAQLHVCNLNRLCDLRCSHAQLAYCPRALTTDTSSNTRICIHCAYIHRSGL